MSKYYECTVSVKDSDTEKVPFKCHLSGLSKKQKDLIEKFFKELPDKEEKEP